MRFTIHALSLHFAALIGSCLLSGSSAGAAAPDWKAVEQALGKPGQVQAGDVFRVGMPRTDLSVNVKGVPVKAGFALGSYAAFRQVGDQAMVMGDLVLLDQEVHGDAVQLARALRQALAASATPLGGGAPAGAPGGAPAIDAKQIEQTLGRAGRDIGGGVFQVVVPRAEAITENGMPLLPAMGIATVLNFQPLDGGRAAITGDFVLVDKEVDPVARALRQHGIDVTAIHNHGLLDTPRLFYMHFWAVESPVTLAQGLKAALDQTNSQR